MFSGSPQRVYGSLQHVSVVSRSVFWGYRLQSSGAVLQGDTSDLMCGCDPVFEIACYSFLSSRCFGSLGRGLGSQGRQQVFGEGFINRSWISLWEWIASGRKISRLGLNLLFQPIVRL